MVDGLEQRMGTRLRVARVDVGSESGRVLAQRYRITAVPAYVLLDGRGSVLYRQVGGRPDVSAIEQRLAR